MRAWNLQSLSSLLLTYSPRSRCTGHKRQCGGFLLNQTRARGLQLSADPLARFISFVIGFILLLYSFLLWFLQESGIGYQMNLLFTQPLMLSLLE